MALLHQKLNAKQLFLCFHSRNSILYVLPQGHNYMGARKGRWKTPLLFCKHHNFLAILFCQNFTTCLKFEYTDDITSHNFESALRLIMTYGFKLVMIGNTTSSTEYTIPLSELCMYCVFFHISHKEIPLMYIVCIT